MARKDLTFRTGDSVVTTTSLGNQEKWFDEKSSRWYKADTGRFEALAEAVASDVLRQYTNAEQLPQLQVAKYWIERGSAHGHEDTFSVSDNFRRPQDSIVTVNTILRNAIGSDYITQFNRRASLKSRMQYLVDVVENATGVTWFGSYLATLFEIDALILNQDRHLNNIALLSTVDGYSPCPVFDNGAAFLLDSGLYRFDVQTQSYISQVQALPFRVSFNRSANTARELYGSHLHVSFSKKDVENIVAPYLEYYPKQLSSILMERITTVFMIQQKKLW